MRTQRLGVTWLELLVTLAIVGILLAMLLPRYTGNVEHARANEAYGNLKLILAGQRVYRLKTGYYLPNAAWAAAQGRNANVDEINQFLRLKIEEKNFVYDAGPSTASTFTATATRRADAPAPYNDDAYQVDENGLITAQGGGFEPPSD